MKHTHHAVGTAVVLVRAVMVLGCTRLFPLMVLLASLAGCGHSAAQKWIKNHGGPLDGSHQQSRAQQAMNRMCPLETDRGLSVTVVNSGEAGGFSWRSGAIVVTRGLVDMLDDDELAAAIAHELGHLHANHHIAPVASLKGCATDEDAETAADLIARELLDAAGVPNHALPRLLEKVANQPGTAESCRRHLQSRIARLEAVQN